MSKINFKVAEGKDYKDRPKFSEIERPEWANTLILSPRAAKLAFTRYQLDMPWSISQALQGTTHAWGETGTVEKSLQSDL